jgi:hypothetical protein
MRDAAGVLLQTSVGLAGVLLVFIGFVYARAESTGNAKRARRYVRLAQFGIIPFAVAMLSAWLSLTAMHGSEPAYTGGGRAAQGVIRHFGVVRRRRRLRSLRVTMALTEAKLKDLTDKLFDELYLGEHHATWTALALNAYNFARNNITPGREPRPDDIAGVLHPVLKAHDALRQHQEDNRAKASRFSLMFTEYVVDQFLSEGGADA